MRERERLVEIAFSFSFLFIHSTHHDAPSGKQQRMNSFFSHLTYRREQMKFTTSATLCKRGEEAKTLVREKEAEKILEQERRATFHNVCNRFYWALAIQASLTVEFFSCYYLMQILRCFYCKWRGRRGEKKWEDETASRSRSRARARMQGEEREAELSESWTGDKEFIVAGEQVKVGLIRLQERDVWPERRRERERK